MNKTILIGSMGTRKVLWSLFVLLALAATAAYLFRAPLAMAVGARIAAQRLAADAGRNNLVKIFDDILDYHATPEEAAETARDAKARYLVLNHIVPLLALPGLEKAFLGDAAAIYSGPLRVAVDGDFFSMPSSSTGISFSHRF